MATCPRCGNDAERLAGDAFSLLYCEFCGDTIDATDLAPREDVGRTIHRRRPGSRTSRSRTTPRSRDGGHHAHT